MTLIDEAAARFGDRPAIITSDEVITYRDLRQRMGEASNNPIVNQFASLRRNPSPILINTSGTTSKPKTACLTQEMFIQSAKSVNQRLGISHSDRYLLALPLNHVAGLAILYRCALSGAAIVTDLKKATVASFVSTQLTRLATSEISHLHTILVGGGPLPNYDNPRIYTSYGMTEMASTIAINGDILPHCEVKLGKNREILVKGASLFLGYRGIANSIDADGWFHTNDLGEISGGKLKILGRGDRTIISGGENVSPERVERELLKIPGVTKAHIYGASDREWGQRVEAQITTTGTITKRSLKLALSSKLEPSHIPKRWEIIVSQSEEK